MKYNNKTKIIISSYDDLKNPVFAGGGAYSVFQLAKSLQNKYDVTVITGTYKNAANEIVDNIKYVRTGSDIFGHKIGQIIYQLALLRFARKANFNVWVEGSTPPFTFTILPLFSKKPVISWVHMICSYDMKRKYKINLRTIENLLCRLYKYIIVPTNWVHNEVKSMNKQADILTIPYGYNQSNPIIMKQNISRKGEILLFIGRIEINQKGLDLLIKSLSLLNSPVKTIIAGTGALNEQKKLQKLIKQFNIQEKIQLVGRVQGEKKDRLFKEALAVIIPSRYETFVTVALESIIYQKPIICFDIPQNNWIPDNYAIKIKPFDTQTLANAINSLVTKKNQKNITLLDKKQFLKQFSWKNFAKEFEAYIAKIAI